MKYNRNEMLEKYLANVELIKLSKLEKNDIQKVNFSEDSGDILIEALKSLLLSFCNGESETLTLRQTNLRINNLSD
jgi:hypothetical protein